MSSDLLLDAFVGGLVGFITGSFVAGGRNIYKVYVMFVLGAVIDVTPRRFLPDRLIWWYNRRA